MDIWLIWVFAGIILFIIEIFTPFLFFLNLAIASFGAAIAAYFGLELVWQVLIFGVLAGVLLGFIRPILMKSMSHKEITSSSVDEKYICKEDKTLKTTNANDGRVVIYDEEWSARSVDGSEIEAGAVVKVVRNEGAVFFVEKIG